MMKLPSSVDPSATLYMDAPFSADARGRAAVTNVDDHVRDLIIAVLFTSPGERVNQPEFGCGLRQLVFAPNGNLIAAATEALAAAALNRWLSDWIVVQKLDVQAVDSTLTIQLTYVRRDTRELSQLVISR
ncbi:MAG TPA: GPW/gp25 family protein [Gemmatimonadaceae bacterium]|nr:GPW/gp25 family protein [Gemmatimonadaceae bacterium]